MDKRIEERLDDLERRMRTRVSERRALDHRLSALETKWNFIFGDGETMKGDLKAINDRIVKLEEAVNKLRDDYNNDMPYSTPPKPHCKTCKDSGVVSVGSFGTACPDCVKKCELCNDVGLNPRCYKCGKCSPKPLKDGDRFPQHCTCGQIGTMGFIQCPLHAPKTSCDNEWHKMLKFQKSTECPKCGEKWTPADPQPERTLEQKFKRYGGYGCDIDYRNLAQIADEHQKPLLLDAEAKGYSIGRKEAIEEFRNKFEEIFKELNFLEAPKTIKEQLRSKLFNG